LSVTEKRVHLAKGITWDRVRAIFGNAEPPEQVWEEQFDYCNEDLKRIAATPYREIERPGFGWYYYLDLAYVELQPDLFRYLFPVCLMEWHDSLLRNEPCSSGDAEFHSGLRKGNILEKMLNPRQRESVYEVFRDSFLERLDAEPMAVEPSLRIHPFAWIFRLNSLGTTAPCVEQVWTPWWEAATRGRAIAVLKYASGLIYFEGENEPFGYAFRGGKYGPALWRDESFTHDDTWLPANLDFLRATLTFDYLVQHLQATVTRLKQTPEAELAEKITADAVQNRELVELRIAELPVLLAGGGADEFEGWSV
jgi:hypothetical protein